MYIRNIFWYNSFYRSGCFGLKKPPFAKKDAKNLRIIWVKIQVYGIQIGTVPAWWHVNCYKKWRVWQMEVKEVEEVKSCQGHFGELGKHFWGVVCYKWVSGVATLLNQSRPFCQKMRRHRKRKKSSSNYSFLLFQQQSWKWKMTDHFWRQNSSLSAIVHIVHFRDDWRKSNMFFVLFVHFMAAQPTNVPPPRF